MSDKKTVLTRAGLTELEEELRILKTIRRKEIAEKIKEARGQGDLSENAEYDAAKDEQAHAEARIVTIEKMLRNVEVIEEVDLDKDKVNLGSTVRLYDEEFAEEVQYLLVGSAEANPLDGRISNESPLGEALIGHKVGDTVTVEAPAGLIQFKIVGIA